MLPKPDLQVKSAFHIDTVGVFTEGVMVAVTKAATRRASGGGHYV